MILPPPKRPTRVAGAIAVVSAIGGALVALHYHGLGLTLSHYDARGHLVVARRIFDSITPGWQQIGAVWLPLPHLVNAIPVQVDAFYRNGASAVFFSILSFAIGAGSIAWIVTLLTGSRVAGCAGAAVYAFNPNVLYLQATPMTEPMLIGLTTFAVALLIDWTMCGAGLSAFAEATADRRSLGGGWSGLPEAALKGPPHMRSPYLVGTAFALACLTRYEAWPVTAAALTLAVWARWRLGDPFRTAVARVAAIAAIPAAAVVAFAIFSRIVVGEWFVSGGFFVPENTARGHALEAMNQIVWGVRALSGYGLVTAGIVGLGMMAALASADRQRSALAIGLSLYATAAVPWAAFVDGHPYRIRYMVPLIAAQAVAAGLAVGLWRRGRLVTILALAAVIAIELHPLNARAPMVVEAQWDRPNVAVRDRVTSYLRAEYHGETIMASMGSLGHYMQELSHAGFNVRDFLHEGNGDIWLSALYGPRPYAGWILIEEKAEGGDLLAQIARENPGFLDGFSRVSEGAGVALYRRDAPPAPQNLTLKVTR